MISLIIHLLMLFVVIWYLKKINGINSSISVTAYDSHRAFLEFCVFLGALLWMQLTWEIMAYDWNYKTMYSAIAAISFPFIAIYYDFKSRDKWKHYIFAGLAIGFSIINVFSAVPWIVLTLPLAAIVSKTNKIFWIESVAVLLIIGGSLFYDVKYFDYNRDIEKDIWLAVIEDEPSTKPGSYVGDYGTPKKY